MRTKWFDFVRMKNTSNPNLKLYDCALKSSEKKTVHSKTCSWWEPASRQVPLVVLRNLLVNRCSYQCHHHGDIEKMFKYKELHKNVFSDISSLSSLSCQVTENLYTRKHVLKRLTSVSLLSNLDHKWIFDVFAMLPISG